MAGRHRLTVVTWNVHGFVGRDGQRDPARVAACLQRLGADVAGLQEVDAGYWRDAHPEIVALERAGTVLYGPTLSRGAARYGNAVVTRLPVVDWRTFDLSVPGHEPRNVLEADLALHDRVLRVLITHLGLSAIERAAQIATLLERAASFEGPLVMLADVNEWYPSARLRLLHDHFGRTPAPRTWPAGWPILALDRIWVRPRAALVHIEAVPGVEASDHLPVRAMLEIAG